MMASWIPTLFLKILFSKSLTANFFENLLFEYYYVYGMLATEYLCMSTCECITAGGLLPTCVLTFHSDL